MRFAPDAGSGAVSGCNPNRRCGGATLFLAVLFSLIILIVDVLYAFIDPRIKAKYQNGGKRRE